MDIKDIRKMTDMYKKQNINFVETLFTDYYILNPLYEHIFKEYFINNREEIAYYNMNKAIISSGYQALSTLDVKNPSGKVFVNAVRLLRFFYKYKRKFPYKECIYYEEGTERDTLLKFKEVEVFDNIEILDNLKADFRKNINDAIGTIPEFDYDGSIKKNEDGTYADGKGMSGAVYAMGEAV